MANIFLGSTNIGKYELLFMFEPNLMEKVTVKDKTFELFISETAIARKVKELADKINEDFNNKDVLFIALLNGSFIFAADFIRHIQINHQIDFIKFKSYAGTESSGKVKELIGLNQNIENKTIIILEDIVDTGTTLQALTRQLEDLKPDSIFICSLLYKPGMLKVNLKPDYTGFTIPDKFVIGYGLDYDGLGRNLKDIYTVVN